MKSVVLFVLSFAVSAGLIAQVKKQTIEGIRNLSIVDGTAACAGATEVTAIPVIAAKGYKAIVNLRQETEAGAAIAESRAAAEKAGMKYIHLSLNAASLEPAVADAFIKAVTDKSNQPVFVHCASGNRAAALWMAKRILVDKWDDAKALDEARAIGLTNAALEKFALDYVAARRK